MQPAQRSTRAKGALPGYAGGGMIGAFKRAIGLEQDTPERAAYKAQAKAAREAQTTPAPKADNHAITDYAGMSAMQRREKEAGLKDGGTVKPGIIKGPGTGTSDSIKAELPNGSFIMPADSTKVMVSNGETNIEPGAVMKIGAAVLSAVRDATHTPVKNQKPEGAIRKLAGGGYLDIPDNAGYKAPAPDGLDDTEFSRNAKNTMYALPGAAPALGAIGALAGATRAGSLMGAAGSGIGAAAAKVAPYGIPAAGLGTISALSDTSQPSPISAQIAAKPQPNPTGVGVGQAGANPTSSIDQTTGVAPASGAVRRVGNSYSGENVSGDISLTDGQGKPIKRGGTVSSLDTSAGYAQDLKDLARIEEGKKATEANLQAQATYAENKVLEQKALAGNRNAEKILAQRTNDSTARRGQDQDVANRGAIAKLAGDKFALDATNSGLDNQLKGVQVSAAKQLQTAQQELLAAKTPEEQQAAERKLITLGGKQPQQEKFAYGPGGQVIDPVTGQLVTQPGVIFNTATGQQAQQGQPQSSASPQAGTPVNKAQYDALPKGAKYTHPDGSTRTKG